MPHRITIPNALTTARMAMAGAAGLLAWRGHAPDAAVAILIAAALLDGFDGWLARRLGQGTQLGQHLDPLADKLLMGVVYGWVGLESRSAFVWALVGLAGVREAGITALRSYSLRREHRFIPASSLGRIKMLVQSVAGLTILSVSHFLDRPVPITVVAVSMLAGLTVSYTSAVTYVVDWRRRRARARASWLAAESKGACRRPEADPLCATHDHG